MSDPIPFTLRTRCLKCLEERCHWEVIAHNVSQMGSPPWSEVVGGNLLMMTCSRCGWKWTMKTADADVDQ